MMWAQKISLLLVLCLFVTGIQGQPETEVQRLRKIVNDEKGWSALSKDQQMNLLSDLFLAEENEATVEKKAREELERSIAQGRQFDQILATTIRQYKDEKPLIVEYLATPTLKMVLDRLDNFTAEIGTLINKYQLSLSQANEFIAKLTGAVETELKKREKPSATDFKSLIIKGLGQPPYAVHFATFQMLENTLKAIDALLHDPQEQQIWATERNVSQDKIQESLTRIKTALLQDKVVITEQVSKDLQKAEAERAEEQRAREHALQVLREAKQLREYQFKIEDVRKTYPQFFQGIPASLESAFLKKFEELYGGNGKNINQILTTLYLDPKNNVQINRLLTLGNLLEFPTYAAGGYVFFDNKGKRTPLSGITLPRVLEIYDQNSVQLNKKVADATKQLVRTYKVHLMPDESMDAVEILLRLSKALKEDEALSSVIQTFKIHYNPIQQGNVTFARVVIYADGKEQAQKIVNALYQNKTIKEMKGSGIRPRYNAKVNDLIWIAQGDGDFKDGIYKGYYEPSLIYYNPGITGKRENYHLISPITQQEIVS